MMEYPDFANLAIIRHDPDMPPEPLTDDECRDMLRSTLHGPLPAIIMHRVFATLAEMPTLRQRAETAERRLAEAREIVAGMLLHYSDDGSPWRTRANAFLREDKP